MPAIVDFPDLVHQQVAQYRDLFANEPERRQCAEYLTGFYVAERKNGSGINRAVAVTTDQSCLNRWLTEVAGDGSKRNARRLELLQRASRPHTGQPRAVFRSTIPCLPTMAS